MGRIGAAVAAEATYQQGGDRRQSDRDYGKSPLHMINAYLAHSAKKVSHAT